MARSSSCELSDQEHFLVFFNPWRLHTYYGAVSSRGNKGVKTGSSERLQEGGSEERLRSQIPSTHCHRNVKVALIL